MKESSVPHLYWKEALSDGAAHDHFAQMYETDETLAEAVSYFAAEGIRKNEIVILVGTDGHLSAVRNRMQMRGELPPESKNRLLIFSGKDLLESFYSNGHIDGKVFRIKLRGILEFVRREFPGMPVRIWGEMVNILWEQGQAKAVIDLEKYWSELDREYPFFLFCTYKMDIFDSTIWEKKDLHNVHCNHSHVIPHTNFLKIEQALLASLEEVCGFSQALMICSLLRNQKDSRMPLAQSLILWLRQHMPLYANRVLDHCRRQVQIGQGVN